MQSTASSRRPRSNAKPSAAAEPRRAPSGSLSRVGEPLRVQLPLKTHAKLAEQASRRGIGIEAVASALIDERLREIDDSGELTQARDWQREQALSTLEKIRAGDLAEVTEEDIEADFADALGGASSPR